MTPLGLKVRAALAAAVVGALALAVLYHRVTVSQLRLEVATVTGERDALAYRNQALAAANAGWSRAALAQQARLEATELERLAASAQADQLARQVLRDKRDSARKAAAAAGYGPEEVTEWFRQYLAP